MISSPNNHHSFPLTMEGFMSTINQLSKFGLFSLLVVALQAGAADKDTSCAVKEHHCCEMSKDSGCSSKKTDLHYFYSSVGTAWFTNSNLNGYLQAMQLSPFRDNVLSISIGEHKQKGKKVEESSFTGQFWADHLNGNLRSSMWSFDVFSNSGFNAIPLKMPLSLFPYFGLGLNLSALHIRSNVTTLPERMNSQQPNAYLLQGALLLNVGIGSDFKFSSPDNKTGFILGYRAGWCYDLYTTRNWYSQGVAISDVPSLRHNGGYVKLVLGGWGPPPDKMKKHIKKWEKS
jgi:hypothetical protein